MLWEMDLAQLILYHNMGIDLKYPKSTNNDGGKLANKKYKELKQIKEGLRKQYGEIE